MQMDSTHRTARGSAKDGGAGMLGRIAWLYYDQGMRQQEIADFIVGAHHDAGIEISVLHLLHVPHKGLDPLGKG